MSRRLSFRPLWAGAPGQSPRDLLDGIRGRSADPRLVVSSTRILLELVLTAANAGAALLSILLVVFVTPGTGDLLRSTQLVENLVVAAALVAVIVPTMVSWSRRALRRALRSLEPDATAADRDRLVRAPLRILKVFSLLWVGIALVFGIYNLEDSTVLAFWMTVTALLVGQAAAAFSYLAAERVLRPAVLLAMEGGRIDRALLLSGTRRQLLGWVTATGGPLIGAVTIGLFVLLGIGDGSRERMGVALVVLGLGGLVAGATLQVLSARALADPVRTVRDAVDRVRQGDLEVRIPVYDVAEIGRLQQGFNRMVAGLQERERLHDLFGRHVGADVARAVLDERIPSGGEQREICALFVDLVGSTTLSAERGPAEVVALLNRFFAVVVDVVGTHGGTVSKFQGDAALVVFGLPTAAADTPDAALRAARVMAERLAERVPEARAGIGATAGPVIAGYVGTEERFEYAVIGDAIDEAQALTDAAKEQPAMVAASRRLVERASAIEQERWRPASRRVLVLRRRERPTDVMTPVTP
ncbi:adenylate/guanylate cyclase domain-containing protein [Patulibacter medicamentivorans]|uniref:adenylate/guanylate cyclase domain-containing protein n=1 Tax=Patulibacter medicamentivorans TaxID=1097667 RepID=UPI0002E450F1|nr:adenylate/guanylate cyclase domain-containing protein [Patulibacter medicamentivorans]